MVDFMRLELLSLFPINKSDKTALEDKKTKIILTKSCSREMMKTQSSEKKLSSTPAINEQTHAERSKLAPTRITPQPTPVPHFLTNITHYRNSLPTQCFKRYKHLYNFAENKQKFHIGCARLVAWQAVHHKATSTPPPPPLPLPFFTQ